MLNMAMSSQVMRCSTICVDLQNRAFQAVHAKISKLGGTRGARRRPDQEKMPRDNQSDLSSACASMLDSTRQRLNDLQERPASAQKTERRVTRSPPEPVSVKTSTTRVRRSGLADGKAFTFEF